MSIWTLVGLVGGLAVFLYGMLLMNDSLTAIAGERLRGVMLSLTRGKVRGYLTGLTVTVFNQSSSATTVLEAVLVGAGLMTFHQSLAVTLGSELGSTFLGQLVAFPKITKLAPIIIAAGFFPSLLAQTRRAKNISLTILGFGVLFLGMEMMADSLEPLKSYQPFLDLMTTVENPALGILLGLVFTMVIQSSGATSGLTIAMAVTNTITLAQAVPINLGASVGTCITAILGSLTLNREAKRVAWIHTAFQAIGSSIAFILLMIPFHGDRLWLVAARWVTATLVGTDSLARQIAMAHTMMPVLNHLIVIPLLPFIVRVFDRVYPPQRDAQPFGPIHINDGLVEQPEIALEQAKKETQRVAGLVEEMLARCHKLLCGSDIAKAKEKEREKEIAEIAFLDQKVDLLREAIVHFLTKIAAQSLSEPQSRTVVIYLNTINELENLADVVDINMTDRIRKFADLEIRLPEEATQEVASLHAMVVDHYKLVMDAFDRDDKASTVAFLQDRGPFKDLQATIRSQHFRRLQQGHKVSLDMNSIYMDLLNHYNRINRHVLHIAKRMAENM
jgi:phosphate:Na+ symporter